MIRKAALLLTGLFLLSVIPALGQTTIGSYDGACTGGSTTGNTPIAVIDQPASTVSGYITQADVPISALGGNNNFTLVVWALDSGTSFHSVATTNLVATATGHQTFTGLSMPITNGQYLGYIATTGNAAICFGTLTGSVYYQIGGSGSATPTTSSNFNAGGGPPALSAVVSSSISTTTTTQTITFPSIANVFLGSGPITLSAVASSGLTVSYAVSGPATLSGNTLTPNGTGTVSVTASQSGNDSYQPASSVTQSFVVSILTVTEPYIQITHVGVQNSDGTLLANGKECFTPVNAQGVAIASTFSYNGVRGTIHKASACAKITNGNITGTYNLDGSVTSGVFQLVDTAYTSPLHLCYQMILTNVNSGAIIIGPHDGFSCVQPTSGGASFEISSILPNVPGIPMVTNIVSGAGSSSPTPTTTTGWNLFLSNQLWVFTGSSITRGYTLSGAQLAHGGVTGNYGDLLAGLMSSMGTTVNTYNEGVDGQTTTGDLAQYTTGNSTYNGVVVPSAHSLSPAQTCSTWSSSPSACPREIFFLDGTEMFNNVNNSINTSTSISDLVSLTTAAKNDGYFVVTMTSPIIYPDPNQAKEINDVNQAMRDQDIPSDIVIDMAYFIPNSCDLKYYQSDCVHFTNLGHIVTARNILGAMISRGGVINYDGSYTSQPQTFGGPVAMPLQKSASGTRYLCIDSTGNVTSSANVCSGT